MIFDWLAREGWIIVNWWLLVTLAGVAVLPLMVRMMHGLPDKGYTLARPAGVLLTSFVFWLLTSFGFLQNTSGSIVLAWCIVLVISIAVYMRLETPFNWRDWWVENRNVVIITEVLFAVLLVGWALFRSYQNGLFATEKPMDLAFMSAIYRSEQFPPNDPWLSGYSISYYYFGYVMAAMLSKLSGVWTTIGYNMHIAMLFALTGIASFGVTYNLIRSRAFRFVIADKFVRNETDSSQSLALAFGVLGAIFVILMGNFQAPLVEYPYNTGIASDTYLDFWDMNGRWEPVPEGVGSNDVARWDNWWWFKGARTISDQNLLDPDAFSRDQLHIEAIAEFPQFSFLLADSHPHVMTLPYVLLAIGIALNVLLIGQAPDTIRVIFYGLCVGALIFLNTWDTPIYIMAIVGADVLRRMIRYGRLLLNDWIQVGILGGALLLITVIAYLPFLVGFQSQLGGILPNLIYPTHSPQYFLMFGPFILLIPFFVGFEVWRARRDGRMNWSLGGQTIAGILAVLIGVAILFTTFGLLNSSVRDSALRYIDDNGGLGEILPEILVRRLSSIPMLILLFAGFWLVVGRLFPKYVPETGGDAGNRTGYSPAAGFALMLVGVGLSLSLIPEFIYLRDNFGTRMNTVFKFYYQVWVVLSIATAYGLYTLFADVEDRPVLPVRAFAGVMLTIVVLLGAFYPIVGIYSRAWVETGRLNSNNPAELTLDGGRTAVSVSANDYAVLMCLNDLVAFGEDVVVGEATGGSYDVSGRVGALTGLPSVIGWQPHQGQWRGSSYFETVGSRPDEIPRLYQDLRFDIVTDIITRYGIDYILYGDVESQRYGTAGREKFDNNLTVVCQSGDSVIYRVDDRVLSMTP